MNFLSNIFETNDKNISYEKIFDIEFEKLRNKKKIIHLHKSKNIELLAEKAFFQISHYLRPSHLKKLKGFK